MSEIRTKIMKRGNPCESEWPSDFGTGGSGRYYYDKEKRSVSDTPPERPNTYGKAPFIITDTIDAYYHPRALMWTDSKSALREMDKNTGTITTDKMIPADPSWAKEQERLRLEDHHKSLHKSVAQIDAGTAPITEETRALCEQQNEIISSALNMDAFNAAGRITNPKGKRYRAKHGKKKKPRS